MISAALLAGCGGERGADTTTEPAAFTVRDSGGVRVAMSTDSSWTVERAWTVAARPSLEIGRGAGAEFGRVVGTVRLGDGRIAVADAQTLDIRVFGADGGLLERFGGRGAGPGEFRRLDNLALIRGDSLVGRNDGLFRHEIYAADGSYGRTVTAPPAGVLFAPVVGWLEDGTFVVGPTHPRGALLEPGRQELLAEWHVFDAAGTDSGVLASLPERLVDGRDVGGLVIPAVVSYSPWTKAATDATGVWFGFASTYELRHFGAGGLDLIVRRSWQAEAVTPELREHYRAWLDRGVRRSDVDEVFGLELVTRLRQAAMLEARGAAPPPLAFADSLPAFVRAIVARDGHLWVEAHATLDELLGGSPGDVATRRWSVFDPEGCWLGTVRTPAGLRVTEIGGDYLLGVAVDSLDVESVRLYAIVKP
ncbi:MAG: hypothetical protein WEB88_07525 [Gemmatimonadota bacterium]